MTKEEDDDRKRLERKEQKTTYIPQKILDLKRKVTASRKELNEFNDGMDAIKNPLDWSREDWRSFFQSTPMDTYRIIKELITKRKSNELKNNLKEAVKKEKVASKIFEITGIAPGEKSGVVKADQIAEKKIKEHLHKVTIYTARLLAYGKDDKLKEDVMKEVTQKYPDLVPKIKRLAEKAKQRANNRIINAIRTTNKR